MRKSKREAVAVVISDVHFNIKTLKLATDSLKQAVEIAKELEVPLIIAGDLNDTKAMLRAECANAIIVVLSEARDADVKIFIDIGNHDLINEKAKEHSLNFLKPYAHLITKPVCLTLDSLEVYVFPYYADVEELRAELAKLPAGQTIIMHQGFKGAFMGEYVVDKTSLDPAEVAMHRVITGHYHRRQTVGTVEYIGTPYTVTFAEANDPAKGFRVLMSDGSLEFVATNLRKHIVYELAAKELDAFLRGDNLGLLYPRSDDLVWLKVKGPASELDKLSKKAIGEKLLGHQNFKLDKIYDEAQVTTEQVEKLTNDQMLDKIIDASEETKPQKKYLKKLWREICE